MSLRYWRPTRSGDCKFDPADPNSWISVDAPTDALIVNIGDMLELWSGGYFVSTPHKVVTRAGHDRYSFPYFAVPRYDVLVAPLCQTQPGISASADALRRGVPKNLAKQLAGRRPDRVVLRSGHPLKPMLCQCRSCVSGARRLHRPHHPDRSCDRAGQARGAHMGIGW